MSSHQNVIICVRNSLSIFQKHDMYKHKNIGTQRHTSCISQMTPLFVHQFSRKYSCSKLIMTTTTTSNNTTIIRM